MSKRLLLYVLLIIAGIATAISYGITADFEYGKSDIQVPTWIPSKTVSIGTTADSASFTIEGWFLSNNVHVTTPSISENTAAIIFLNSSGKEYYQSTSMSIPDTKAAEFDIEKTTLIAGPGSTTIRLKLANNPTVTGNYTIRIGGKPN